jgi:hypothetical protein
MTGDALSGHGYRTRCKRRVAFGAFRSGSPLQAGAVTDVAHVVDGGQSVVVPGNGVTGPCRMTRFAPIGNAADRKIISGIGSWNTGFAVTGLTAYEVSSRDGALSLIHISEPTRPY